MTCHPVALPENSGVATSYRTVAVIGPPNSGKTTLYNRLTGLRQKVGNFPGVTVEHHIGYIKNRDGEEVALVDLPGIYSLTPKSEDERVSVDVLQGRMPGMARPDAIIVVLNVNNLHTHLVLAGRVIALGLPTLVLLNMADELHKQDGAVDVLALARELGTPVALVSATTGEGLDAVAELYFDAASPAPNRWTSRRRQHPQCARVGGAGGRESPATAAQPLRSGPRASTTFSLHRVWGPLIFVGVVVGGLPDDLRAGPAALGPVAEVARFRRR